MVGLWGVVEGHGGLQAGMDGDMLSQGQKQLFSLARAVLRGRVRAREMGGGGDIGGVLILDEVSGNVDGDTERVMYEVVGKEFGGYTVVMVSHRLEMVMGFDRVVVMDSGRIVEEGAPRELVGREGGWFRGLVCVGGEGR